MKITPSQDVYVFFNGQVHTVLMFQQGQVYTIQRTGENTLTDTVKQMISRTLGEDWENRYKGAKKTKILQNERQNWLNKARESKEFGKEIVQVKDLPIPLVLTLQGLVNRGKLSQPELPFF